MKSNKKLMATATTSYDKSQNASDHQLAPAALRAQVLLLSSLLKLRGPLAQLAGREASPTLLLAAAAAAGGVKP